MSSTQHTANAAHASRELASRDSDGLYVRLLWHPNEDVLTVSVDDSRSGHRLDFDVERDRGHDAFYEQPRDRAPRPRAAGKAMTDSTHVAPAPASTPGAVPGARFSRRRRDLPFGGLCFATRLGAAVGLVALFAAEFLTFGRQDPRDCAQRATAAVPEPAGPGARTDSEPTS